MKITKSIIPAAGLGTRFLPLTKVIPKEMLPLGSTPAIHTIVQEGINSGIDQFFIIANKDKHVILDYFKPDQPLDKILQKAGKSHRLDDVREIAKKAQISAIEQPEPLGFGQAILLAEKNIGNQFFGIQLPDDLILCGDPGLRQLIDQAQKYQATVIAVQEVPKEQLNSYGIIAPKQALSSDLFEVDHVVEKPKPEAAPSNLAIIGRYVVSPAIFEALKTIPLGAGGEYQFTDALDHMIKHGKQKVLAYKIKGTRHDIGTPRGWFKAIIDIIRHDTEMADLLDQ